MAASLLRGEARIYAQRYIVAGVREGLTGNQILQNLRNVSVDGQSLGYRTETFYEDFNRYSSAKRLPAATRLPSLPDNFSTDYSFKIPSTGGHRFNYMATVTGIDRNSGETVDIPFSFTSPIPILDELLPDAFKNAFENMYQQVDYNPEDVVFSEPREFFSEVP